jgi:hypothetical protein
MNENTIPVDQEENVSIRGPEFTKMAASQRQYTGFLDSDHGEVEIWEALGKEENIKALADAGIKHLFLEQKRDRHSNSHNGKSLSISHPITRNIHT